MRAYHRTAHGEDILRNGFRDASGFYLTSAEWTGVWLASMPLDENEGAQGNELLAVEIPDEVFEEYEWVEEGKGYREALIRAEIVNRYPVEAVSEEEQDAWSAKRWRGC